MTSDDETKWLGEHRFDGRLLARLGRRRDELLAEFPDTGTLFVWKDKLDTRARFEPLPGTDAAVVEKLMTSLGPALQRHLQGGLTLHGGCAGRDTGALAFIGPSGAGKSTLVAALCKSGEMDLIADDTVAIDVPSDDSAAPATVVRTQKSAWLLPSARSCLGFDATRPNKVPVEFRSAGDRVTSLRAIFALVFDPESPRPALRRLRGQEAFSFLSQSVIRLVIDEPKVQEREFTQLRSLMECCPLFELRRSKDFTQLEDSAEVARKLLFERIPRVL